jgi:hypothetical protein
MSGDGPEYPPELVPGFRDGRSAIAGASWRPRGQQRASWQLPHRRLVDMPWLVDGTVVRHNGSDPFVVQRALNETHRAYAQAREDLVAWMASASPPRRSRRRRFERVRYRLVMRVSSWLPIGPRSAWRCRMFDQILT